MAVHDRESRGAQTSTTSAPPETAPGRTTLAEHGAESGDRTPSLSLGGGRGGGGTSPPALATTLDQFALRFNQEFRAQLHAFADLDPITMPIAERGPREAVESRDTATATSGDGLTAAQLSQLFTPRQIGLLDSFMGPGRVIPDRLFDGDDVGTATAQQRILLAGHILATGTYAPGSFSQRVHARMCGHWVNLVYTYAGCATSMGAGAREEFDHTGALALGVSEDTGSVTGMARPGLDRGLGLGDHFSRTLARDDFEQIQAGDWLYVQNHNSSASGNHSVIFSRWATGWDETPVPHRRAVTMSQGSPDGGGHEEMRALGPSYFAGPPMVTPITHVTRVPTTARPMTSVEDLVAILGHGPEAADNARFIARIERGGHFDAEMFKSYLREQNDARITELASHRTTSGASIMTAQQQRIFRDTNQQATELPVLVRLYQRLGVLVDNAAAVETERDDRGAAIDANHAEAEAEVAPRRDALEDQIEAIDAQLRELQAQADVIEPTVDLYDSHHRDLTAALVERRTLRGERQDIRDGRRATTRGERAAYDDAHRVRLAEIEARLAVLQATIDRLQPEERETRGDRRDARRALRQIEGQIRRANNQRAQLQRRLDSLEGDSGYHTAHGGVGRADFNGTDERRTVTGRLRDLVPQPNWQQFVRPAGAGESPIQTTLQ